MVVYVEYALAENFLLDGLLLYLALKIARGRVSLWRLLLAAGVGAAEAVCFPLLTVPVWCAYLLKILGGLLLCVLVVSKGRVKTYVVVTAAFFLMTFALGGLLTAAYSFFGVEYEEGRGYLVEQAPVALVLAAAGIFTVLAVNAAKYFYRYIKLQRKIVDCTLEQGGRTAHWRGLADSGNLLEYEGKPVCVVSALAAIAIFGRNPKEAGRLTMRTVTSQKETPVLLLEKMQVNGRNFENVYLAVGEVESKEYQIILHTAFMEGCNEIDAETESATQKGRGRRKRRSLSLRKRGASAPAFKRRGE